MQAQQERMMRIHRQHQRMRNLDELAGVGESVLVSSVQSFENNQGLLGT
jgi:hypothetical protein